MIAKKLNCRKVQQSLYLTIFDFKLYYYSKRLIDKSNILSQRFNYSTSSNNNQNIILIKPKFLAIYVIEGMIVKDKEKALLIDIYIVIK